MPGFKTARKTSNKKVTVKVKPTKEKKVKAKRVKKPTYKDRNGNTRVGGALTAVLNTYKTVKRKIVPPKETRIANRTARQENREEKRAAKKPISSRVMLTDNEYNAPVRKTQGAQITEDLQYSINPVTRKIDYDSATNSELLQREKDLGDFEIYADRKPKKDYTIYYILLAAVVIFLLMKQKK